MAKTAVLAIRFLGDASSATKATATAEKQLTKFDKAQRVINKGAKLAVAGFAAVGAAAFKLAQGAAEDQQAAAKLAQTLKTTTGATSSQVAAVESWITKQGKLTGITDDQLRPAMGKLATATGSVTKAQKLALLAQDVSIGTGKNYQSVVDALAKAQNGSVGGLARLGIATKDASGKTKTFAQLQADLATKFKGQAATAADTTAGKVTILKTQLSEAGETIGYVVLPIISKLVDILVSRLVPGIDKTFAFISSHQTTFKVLAALVAAVGAAFIAASVALKVHTAAMEVHTVATKLAAAGQWLLNAAMSANPIALVVIAVVALGAALVIAYKKSETFRAIVKGAFDTVESAAKAVADFFTMKIPAAFQVTMSKATAAKQWITGRLTDVLTFVRHLPGQIRSGAGDLFKSLRDKAAGLKDAIKGRVDSIVGYFKDLPGRLKNAVLGGEKTLSSLGSTIIEKIVSGLSKAVSVGADLASGVKKAVAGVINKGIDKINSALEFKYKIPVVGKTISFNPPNLPHIPLAAGGIVTSPTLTLLGDNRARREAVVPLEKADQFGFGGGDTILQVYLELDGQVLGPFVTKHVDRAMDRQGHRILSARAAV